MRFLKRKYNNVRTTIDGINFDSKREALRYQVLKQWQREGKIGQIKVHPSYLLQEKFDRDDVHYRAITYEADFEYVELSTGFRYIEDVKGFRTEVYKIKKKLLIHSLPFETYFREIK